MNIRLHIRQIIQEEFNKHTIDTNQLCSKLVFLVDFQLLSQIDKIWKFVNEVEGTKTIIEISLDNNGWKLDYDVIGNLRNQKADFRIGPIDNFEEFVKQANQKLNNNMLTGVGNHDSNIDVENESFVKEMIEKMLERKNEIKALPKGKLDDLQKLCGAIEKALINKTIDQIIPSLYSQNKNLTGIVNILNKIEGLDFYKSMDKGGF